MVWKRNNRDVPAEDVTRRYTRRRKVTFRLASPAEVTVRREGRLVAQAKGTDSVIFELPAGLAHEVSLRPDSGGAPTSRSVTPSDDPEQTVDLR
jgi:hypothetical protein